MPPFLFSKIELRSAIECQNLSLLLKDEKTEILRQLIGNCSDGLEDWFKSPTTSDDHEKETLSAFYRKLKEDTEEKKPAVEPDETSSSSSWPAVTAFRFFNMEVQCDVLSMLRFHQCGELDLLYMEDEINRKSCASSLRLLCENCGWKHWFYTSKQQGKSFEVNRRIVYCMRSLGKGHTGAIELCTLMNMPPPPAAKYYLEISSVISSCLRSIAKAQAKQLRMSEFWRSRFCCDWTCQLWSVLWLDMAEKGIFVKKWLCNRDIYWYRKSAWC